MKIKYENGRAVVVKDSLAFRVFIAIGSITLLVLGIIVQVAPHLAGYYQSVEGLC